MLMLIYFKLAMIVVVLVLSFLLFAIPSDFSTGWGNFRDNSLKSMFDIQDGIFPIRYLGTIFLNFSIPIIAMIILIVFIRRRKHFPALISAFVVLWFSSSNQIQLLLSVVILLLFFIKSTRTYFRSANAIEPEPAAEEQVLSLEDGEDGDAQATPLTKPQSKGKRDPEVYIREATPEDAETIHSLMLIAFEEYKDAVPPSSALEETEEAIAEALREERESAAILYEDDTAIAMVRFKYEDDRIYFFRLSVIPARRRRGYAKQLVKWIEKQGITKGMNVSRCRVRQSINNNLGLYQDMGYEIVDQELIVRPAGTVRTLTLDKKLGI